MNNELLDTAAERYFRSPTPDNREDLARASMDVISAYARRLAKRGLPASIEITDLIAEGFVGWLQAVDRFEISRGVLFRTFIEQRVRGAMVDYLRSLSSSTRGTRLTVERVRKHALEAGRELRSYTLEDIRTIFDTTEAHAAVVYQYLYYGGLVHDLKQDTEEDFHQIVEPVDPSPNAEQRLAVSEQVVATRQILKAAFRQLPVRERRILLLYWVDGIPMAEIGQMIGVNESRISQLVARGLNRLRFQVLLRDTNNVLGKRKVTWSES